MPALIWEREFGGNSSTRLWSHKSNALNQFKAAFKIDNRKGVLLPARRRVARPKAQACRLSLVPLIQGAWMDGAVSHAERDRIVKVARSEG